MFILLVISVVTLNINNIDVKQRKVRKCYGNMLCIVVGSFHRRSNTTEEI